MSGNFLASGKFRGRVIRFTCFGVDPSWEDVVELVTYIVKKILALLTDIPEFIEGLVLHG